MAAITGIGEALLRLTPRSGETFDTASALTVHVGGTEANVCAALAHLGVTAAWISRLPATPLGRRVAVEIRGAGVDTGGVLWAPDGRVGLMIVDPGAAPRSGAAVYYRRDSAFAGIDPDDVAWDRLDGSRVVHLTGITPALGAGPRRTVERAIVEGRRRGAVITFDVNYRETLWPPGEARNVLTPFLEEADVVFIGARDADRIFEAGGEPEEVAAALRRRFRCSIVALTAGDAGAAAADGERVVRQTAYPAALVDRVGRGDAFAAGFIYGLGLLDPEAEQGRLEHALRCGAALAALKQTYPGDICRATLGDLECVLRGETGDLRR